MAKILITDVDGCLLQWRPSFIEWLKRFDLLVKEIDNDNYNFGTYLKTPGEKGIHLSDGKAGEDFSRFLSEVYNCTYDLRKLSPVPGSVRALHTLHENGWIIKAVSSYTDDFETMKSREYNLTNVFGDVFAEIKSLPLRSSKKEYLSRQNKDAVFIEDSVNNIRDAVDVGFKAENCFCIVHPYNAEDWYGFTEANDTNQYRYNDWWNILYQLT